MVHFLFELAVELAHRYAVPPEGELAAFDHDLALVARHLEAVRARVLARRRDEEALTLLREHVNDNGVLLRAAIAARRIGTPRPR